MREKHGEPTFDPNVRYPNTAMISYMKAAPPIDEPMTTFILAWVLRFISLKMGKSYILQLSTDKGEEAERLTF